MSPKAARKRAGRGKRSRLTTASSSQVRTFQIIGAAGYLYACGRACACVRLLHAISLTLTPPSLSNAHTKDDSAAADEANKENQAAATDPPPQISCMYECGAGPFVSHSAAAKHEADCLKERKAIAKREAARAKLQTETGSLRIGGGGDDMEEEAEEDVGTVRGFVGGIFFISSIDILDNFELTSSSPSMRPELTNLSLDP